MRGIWDMCKKKRRVRERERERRKNEKQERREFSFVRNISTCRLILLHDRIHSHQGPV